MKKIEKKEGDKKLSLNKETVRQLTNKELDDVQGGKRMLSDNCPSVAIC